MHITALSLSHFRSHRQVRIAVDARPIAVHGANGVGKTNILEALSLLSPGRGLRRASADDMTRRPESLGWKVSVNIAGTGVTREIETWSDGGAARQVRVDGKGVPQTALAEMLRILWLIPSQDRLWIEGAEGRRRFLDRVALSFTPDHAQASLDYDKAMRDRNRLLKEQVQDPHWYRALEMQMATAGVAIHANRQAALATLADAQRGAQTTFPVADLMLVNSASEMPEQADDLRAAFEESRRRDMLAGRTLIGPHRADLDAVYAAKAVPAKACSTGEQKALLVSLILANARALTDQLGSPPVLLLDEVAAHLDPERRAALFDEICDLKVQAWMTGTERSLFDALATRCTYLRLDADGDAARVSIEP